MSEEQVMDILSRHSEINWDGDMMNGYKIPSHKFSEVAYEISKLSQCKCGGKCGHNVTTLSPPPKLTNINFGI